MVRSNSVEPRSGNLELPARRARPHSRLECCLLALGSFAMVQVAGAAAWAQNCPNYDMPPQPAASQADVDVTSRTFTAANPLVVRGDGADGCVGREGGGSGTSNGHGSGGTGQAGGAGAHFSATYGTGVVVQGGAGIQTSMAYVSARGGSGGVGGFSDAVRDGSTVGGNGGGASATNTG